MYSEIKYLPNRDEIFVIPFALVEDGFYYTRNEVRDLGIMLKHSVSLYRTM